MRGDSHGCLPGLGGKVAVVTGGASGIGRAIAQVLAAFGASVALIDVSEEKGRETVEAIEGAGGSAYFTRGDVTLETEMRRCMSDAAGRFGGIDVLVNNAGIARSAPFEELSLDLWRQVLEVNLTGAFICTKAALAHLLARGGGVVVMVSSGSALTGSGASAAYAASKGGLNSLVRALSRELAPKGIRVNGVAPRSIESELLSRIYGKEQIDKMAKEIPLGRMGTFEDVARVVAFLASDLSAFMSGETILVDGGRTFGK